MKTEQEIIDLFQFLTLEFKFRSENLTTFESLVPVNMNDGNYYKFEVTFFDNDIAGYFRHSDFMWLKEEMQLFQVVKINISTHEREEIYFKPFVSPEMN